VYVGTVVGVWPAEAQNDLYASLSAQRQVGLRQNGGAARDILAACDFVGAVALSAAAGDERSSPPG
jgi:hypothetical protein